MNRNTLRLSILFGLFLIPFVPFLVSSSLYFPFIATKAFTWRIIVEIVFALWTLLAIVAPEFRPRRSPMLYALGAFLLIIGLADLFGQAPVKSFWSNFERMEGYITMLHLGAMYLVMSTVLKTREWKWWWNTSLVASAIMIVYCLFQLAGALEIHQGGARVDGTLGNAAYLALYLLIHIFITLFFLIRSRGWLRWVYGALLVAQVAILYFTATRGAILGLLGGFFVIAILNIWNRENPRLRRLSVYLLGGLLALVLAFFLAKDTAFVKGSPILSRLSSISLAEWKSEGRSYVWVMALKGVKEKPILGWGQDNFNYIFAEHYSAEMFHLEPWFDRAHNIFLDWAVAGGILGLGAYLALYVVLLLAIWRNAELSRLERSVLVGLLAAYFFNNVFVFDNLVSYILFVALLAQFGSRSLPVPVSAQSAEEGDKGLAAYAAPIGLALVAMLYFLNVKPLVANAHLIDALQANQGAPGGKRAAIANFELAYESRLGRPETVEWISSTAADILGDKSLPDTEKQSYYNFASMAVEDMTKSLQGDPRYEIVAGNFYSSIGKFAEAEAHLKKALALMPEKQIIYFNLGQLAIYKGDAAGALAYFKKAYELAPEYTEAKVIYLLGAIYAKDVALERSLAQSLDPMTLLTDKRIFSAMYQTGQKALLIETLNTLETRLPQYKADIEKAIRDVQSGNV